MGQRKSQHIHTNRLYRCAQLPVMARCSCWNGSEPRRSLGSKFPGNCSASLYRVRKLLKASRIPLRTIRRERLSEATLPGYLRMLLTPKLRTLIKAARTTSKIPQPAAKNWGPKVTTEVHPVNIQPLTKAPDVLVVASRRWSRPAFIGARPAHESRGHGHKASDSA